MMTMIMRQPHTSARATLPMCRHRYCTSYSSLPESLTPTHTHTANIVSEYQYIKQLFDAARTTVAHCPTTGFPITTPFQPLAWALRLAASALIHTLPPLSHLSSACDSVWTWASKATALARKSVPTSSSAAEASTTAISDNIVKELGNGRRQEGPFATPHLLSSSRTHLVLYSRKATHQTSCHSPLELATYQLTLQASTLPLPTSLLN